MVVLGDRKHVVTTISSLLQRIATISNIWQEFTISLPSTYPYVPRIVQLFAPNCDCVQLCQLLAATMCHLTTDSEIAKGHKRLTPVHTECEQNPASVSVSRIVELCVSGSLPDGC